MAAPPKKDRVVNGHGILTSKLSVSLVSHQVFDSTQAGLMKPMLNGSP